MNLANQWLSTKEAAAILNRDIRTVQKMAASGLLKWKKADGTNARLYELEDLQRYLKGGAPKDKPAVPAAITVRTPKPTQNERALDTVSIVGNLVAGHKAELEMLVAQAARNLETIVTLILTAQKAEADANRERLKAEREDIRERWEMERQDRPERRKTRIEQPMQNGKTSKAHA